MSASADVLALASAEFEVSGIAEGTTLTVKWRGMYYIVLIVCIYLNDINISFLNNDLYRLAYLN